MIVFANGVELCAESFGERGDPAILLIMGSSASMDWWEAEFCERLAAAGRHVIRYDHRDTGRSVTYPAGAPGYDFDDLVDDAVDLLEVLVAGPAHVAGMSMGGAIAQVIALAHPERVTSLTLISTSPVAYDGPELPSMSEGTGARFAAAPEPDLSDDEEVIDYLEHLARASASPARPFDSIDFRRLAACILARSTDIEATLKNHDLISGGPLPSKPLAELDVPTLVVHGEDDPVLPFPHGQALASEIPGARMLALGETGHDLPRHSWDQLIPAIVELTSNRAAA
jgi:pimeloyl-ACP methyl ester carboxylesterase